jgi:hypothetical protein
VNSDETAVKCEAYWGDLDLIYPELPAINRIQRSESDKSARERWLRIEDAALVKWMG